jgi:hypothetical protein
VEARATSGADRVGLSLWVRGNFVANAGYYVVRLEPAAGRASLHWNAGGGGGTLAERADLGALLAADGWNSVAVRMQGPKLWVLINDQEVLSAVDGALDEGIVALGVFRSGPLEDA